MLRGRRLRQGRQPEAQDNRGGATGSLLRAGDGAACAPRLCWACQDRTL